MVEETTTVNKTQKTKTARPKAVYSWGVSDVQKWFKRHCAEYLQYSEIFLINDITGSALLRITDDSLKRMEIDNNEHREVILREIMKQRLKTDIMEIRDLELMNNVYENCF